MRWSPIESPIVKAKRDTYKLLVKTRAALILLASAWHMEPRHFQRGTDSIYKNLGWWIPVVPGVVYAWAMHVLFWHLLAEREPSFPSNWLPVFSIFFAVFLAHLTALTDLGFHALICLLGRIFGMRESPPPYEFFLVRFSGGFMWLAVSFCIMGLPILALRQDTIGYFASSLMAVPLIWLSLFMVASHSWQRIGSSGRVGPAKMYQSERFVKLFWRIECSLMALTILGLIYLNWHPDFLVWLFTPKH